MNNEKVMFPGVEDGGTFEVDGIVFIKFPSVDGKTPVVAKNILCNSKFGETPNFADSYILSWLESQVLPGIIEAVGEENVCEFETDLTTLDGLKPYHMKPTKISLPTFDFYRANVGIFDKYPVRKWWWLATPDTALPHCDADWGVSVSPSGCFSNICNGDFGVRPILFFVSSIFGSSET